MRAFDSPATHVQGRANKLVNPERLRASRRANNIHQRIYRANFVKVDFFDRHVVNLGFSCAKLLENRNCGVDGGLADLRTSDDLANLF